MTIIEQNIVPKNAEKKSEDGIVVTDDFIAVIDGSTSKTDRRFSLRRSNGRYAMELVAHYLRKAPKTLSCHQFCLGVTKHIRKRYTTIGCKLHGGLQHLAEHPEERLTASAIVYSRLHREIWMIGDCQCLVGNNYYDNPKPTEDEMANRRASIIQNSHLPKESFLNNDTAREAILPALIQSMQRQNKDYAVIDGFPIPEQHVRIITLDFQPWEIVFASDGYPWLRSTLAESEEKLRWQRENDPLNIGDFKATKAFMNGQASFDDRAYIRFRV
jgi:glycerophosphoryl diester phosphodiesterase